MEKEKIDLVKEASSIEDVATQYFDEVMEEGEICEVCEEPTRIVGDLAPIPLPGTNGLTVQACIDCQKEKQ